jgi:hypothetical protein
VLLSTGFRGSATGYCNLARDTFLSRVGGK